MVRWFVLMGALALIGCGEAPSAPEPTQAERNEFFDEITKEARGKPAPPPRYKTEDFSQPPRSAESSTETKRKYHEAMRETEQERRIELLQLERQRTSPPSQP